MICHNQIDIACSTADCSVQGTGPYLRIGGQLKGCLYVNVSNVIKLRQERIVTYTTDLEEQGL